MENKSPNWEEILIYDGYNMAYDVPKGCDEEEFTSHLHNVYNQIDLLSDSFITRCRKEGLNVDCKMGCSWCCYQAVFALTHEMLVIANYIRQNFVQETIDAIHQRAKKKAELTKNLTREELLKFKHACPLLEDGKCMVYPVRPLACRIYLSADVETCKMRYNRPADKSVKPALYGFMMDGGKNMNYGFVHGLKEKGLISNEAPVEWLLEQLLVDDTAFNKWLNGTQLNENFVFEDPED